MAKQTKKKKENSKIKEFFRVILSAYSRKKMKTMNIQTKLFHY